MVCIKIPTLQNEMYVFLSLTFRYFTCLLDKGHIKTKRQFCQNIYRTNRLSATLFFYTINEQFRDFA